MTRGAVWSKWDLHVHTPLSVCHQYKGSPNDAWEKFILDLENLPKEFKVIGINDYYFIEGYKKILKEKEKGRLTNIDLFLPVIELRIDSFAGNTSLKKINYHIIFSNEVSVNEIQDHFISALRIKYEIERGKPFNELLNQDSLETLGARIRKTTPQEKRNTLPGNRQLGFNSLTIKLEEIEAALKNHRFKNKYLIGIGKVEWDSLRWDGAAASKRNIINKADFLFTASFNDSAYKRSKSWRKWIKKYLEERTYGRPKPLNNKEKTNLIRLSLVLTDKQDYEEAINVILQWENCSEVDISLISYRLTHHDRGYNPIQKYPQLTLKLFKHLLKDSPRNRESLKEMCELLDQIGCSGVEKLQQELEK